MGSIFRIYRGGGVYSLTRVRKKWNSFCILAYLYIFKSCHLRNNACEANPLLHAVRECPHQGRVAGKGAGSGSHLPGLETQPCPLADHVQPKASFLSGHSNNICLLVVLSSKLDDLCKVI